MRSGTAYSTPVWESDNRAVLRYWFGLFCALVLLRFLLNANLLDKIVNYSAEGGTIVTKIHPSTYGIFAVLIGTLVTTRIELGRHGGSPGFPSSSATILEYTALAEAVTAGCLGTCATRRDSPPDQRQRAWLCLIMRPVLGPGEFHTERWDLLPAYLYRRYPRWREDAQGDAATGSGPVRSGKMTKEEGYEILGAQDRGAVDAGRGGPGDEGIGHCAPQCEVVHVRVPRTG